MIRISEPCPYCSLSGLVAISTVSRGKYVYQAVCGECGLRGIVTGQDTGGIKRDSLYSTLVNLFVDGKLVGYCGQCSDLKPYSEFLGMTGELAGTCVTCAAVGEIGER